MPQPVTPSLFPLPASATDLRLPVEYADSAYDRSADLATSVGSKACQRKCASATSQLAEQKLETLLHAPFAPGAQYKHAILLYPDTPDDVGMAQPATLVDLARAEPEELRLVVIDGTWRKSRKMLYANPLLQSLPHLPLRDAPASQYLIRKANGAHQLSTLEATCYALMQLEKNNAGYAPLLEAFNGFVAQQLSYREAGRGRV
jgi:DTW domain-containing protein YfiP